MQIISTRGSSLCSVLGAGEQSRQFGRPLWDGKSANGELSGNKQKEDTTFRWESCSLGES